MKRFTSGVLSLILICGCTATAQAKTFTEDEIMKLYVEKGAEFQLLDLDRQLLDLEYEVYEKEVKRKKSQSNRAENQYNNGKNSSNESKKDDLRDAYYSAYDTWANSVKELSLMAYKKENQEKYYDAKEKQLKFELSKQLDSYRYNVKRLALLEEKKSLSKEYLTVEEKKLELGLNSELDLKKAENQYLATEIQVEAFKNVVESQRESLLLSLDLSVDTKVDVEALNLLDNDTKPFDIQYGLLTTAYKKDNYAYNLKVFEQEELKKYMDAIREKYNKKSDDLEKKELEQAKKVFEYSEYKQQVDVNLLNQYYNFKNMADTLRKEKDAYQLSVASHKESQLAFKVGNISELDYRSAEVKYKEAELAYEKALLDYLQSVEALELLLDGVELNVK